MHIIIIIYIIDTRKCVLLLSLFNHIYDGWASMGNVLPMRCNYAISYSRQRWPWTEFLYSSSALPAFTVLWTFAASIELCILLSICLCLDSSIVVFKLCLTNTGVPRNFGSFFSYDGRLYHQLH